MVDELDELHKVRDITIFSKMEVLFNCLTVSSTNTSQLHPKTEDKHRSPPYSRLHVSHPNTTQARSDLSPRCYEAFLDERSER